MEKDDLQKEISEVAKAIKDSVLAELKSAIKEPETPAPAAPAPEIKVASPYDMYELSRSKVMDLSEDKAFSEDTVKRFATLQRNADDVKMKNYIFFKALVASGIQPKEYKFHQVLKALSEGTPADGGYLVTPEFRTEVLRRLFDNGIMRPEVNVIPVSTDSVNFNYENGRPVVSWGTENTTISTTSAALGQTTISVYRMNALMYMSREVVNDSSPAIMDWISSEFVDSVKEEEDRVICVGSGTGQPTGINSASLTTTAAGSSLTFEDYVDVVHSLPVQYRTRGNAKWFMHDRVLRDTLKLKDSNGLPIYYRSIDQSAPGLLMGYPVVVCNYLPDSSLFFGDLKRTYNFLDRQSISVETTTEGAGTFEKHQMAIKITERIGGNAIRTEALVKGTGFSA